MAAELAKILHLQPEDFCNDREDSGTSACALAAEQEILEMALFVHPEGLTVQVTGIDRGSDSRAEVIDSFGVAGNIGEDGIRVAH